MFKATKFVKDTCILDLTEPWSINNSPTVITLRPRQNGRHFADDIFKCIFLNGCVWILITISLKCIPCRIINIPALVQIMAWRRSREKPSSEPMVVRLPTHICVTRPKWLKHPQRGLFGYDSMWLSLISHWSLSNTDSLHVHIIRKPYPGTQEVGQRSEVIRSGKRDKVVTLSHVRQSEIFIYIHRFSNTTYYSAWQLIIFEKPLSFYESRNCRSVRW